MFRHLFRRPARVSSPPTPVSRRGFVPLLERLEDRVTPASATWNAVTQALTLTASFGGDSQTITDSGGVISISGTMINRSDIGNVPSIADTAVRSIALSNGGQGGVTFTISGGFGAGVLQTFTCNTRTIDLQATIVANTSVNFTSAAEAGTFIQLTGNSLINAPNITLDSTQAYSGGGQIDGANTYNLTLAATSGVSLNTDGVVNGSGVQGFKNIPTLSVQGGGTVSISQAQSDTNLGSVSFLSPVSTTGSVSISATTSIQFTAGYAGGGNNLTLSAPSTTLTGVSNVNTLTTSNATTLGGNITTTGNQTYGGAVNLSQDVTLTAPTVTMNSTLGGNGHNFSASGVLNLNGGTTSSFAGFSTTNLALGSNVTVNATSASLAAVAGNNHNLTVAATTTLNGTSNFGTGSLTLSGPVTLIGSTNITGAALTFSNGLNFNFQPNSFSGAVSFGGTVSGYGSPASFNNASLAADTTFAGTSSLTLSGVTTGNNHALAFTSGTAVLTGTVSGLTSVTSSVGVSVSGSVSTSGNQAYNGGLTLTGNASLLSSSGSVSEAGGAVSLGSSTLTVSITAPSTIVDPISGSGGISVSGSVLTLLSASTYTGATVITASTLKLGTTNALPTGTALSFGGPGALDLNGFNQTLAALPATGTITDSAGAATFTLNNSGPVSFGGTMAGGNLSLVKAGAGTLTLSSGNSYGGATTITAGTVKLGNINALPAGTALTVNGTLDLNGFNQTVVAVTGTGTVTDAGGAASFTINNSGPDSFAGVISGANLGLVKGGAGVLTLPSVSNYGGPTVISAGTLRLGATNVLPTGTALTVNGTLDLGGSNQAVASVTGSGTVTDTGGAALFTVTNSGPDTFAGSISGAALSLLVAGTGTLTLSSANTYGGFTSIVGGAVLSVSSLANGGSASGLGISSSAASNLVLNGGTLLYTGPGASTDRLFTLGASGGTIDSSGTGALTFTNSGAVATSTGATLTLTGSNYGTLAPGLGDGSSASSLVKAAANTWYLTGNNTYSGTTTISAGNLGVGNFTATGTLGSGTVTDNGGLYLLRSNAVTIATVIQGTGFVFQQSGTTTLTGANSFSGGTNVAGGTLLVSNPAAVGTGTLQISNNATFAATSALTITNPYTVPATGGTVGGANALTFSGPGSLAGPLTVAGAVTLNNVTLAADITFSGPGPLTLGTVTAGGHAVTFQGATVLSGSFGLFSTVTANAAVTLTGTITSTGAQTYNAPLTLGGAATVTSTGGAVNFAGAVTFGGNDLTVSGTGVTIAGNSVSAGNSTVTGFGVLTVTNLVQSGAATENFQSGGSVVVNNAAGSASNLAFYVPTTITGTVSNASFIYTYSTLTLNGTVTSINNQYYNGLVTLAGNSSVNSAGTTMSAGLDYAGFTLGTTGPLTLGGTISNYPAVAFTGLQLGADTTFNGSSTVSINGLTGNGHGITFQSPTALAGGIGGLTTLTANSAVTVNGTVSSSGQQTYNGGVALAGTSTFITTGAATVIGGGFNANTFNATFSGTPLTIGGLVSGSGTITASNVTLSSATTFAGPVALTTLTGGGNAVVFQGTTTLAGTVSGLSSLDATGAVTLNAATVSTSGAQTYAALALTGGTTTIAGASAIDITGGLNFNNIAFNYTAPLTLAGSVINFSNVTFTNLTLGGNATFVPSPGGVTFNNLFGAGFALTLNGNAATLNGVSNLGSLTATSAVTVNGPVYSTGSQAYTSSLTLGSDSTLSASTVTLGTAVNGPHVLAVMGNLTFDPSTVSGLTQLSVSGLATLTAATSTLTVPSVILSGGITGTGGGSTFTVAGNLTLGGSVSSLDTLTVTGVTALAAGPVTLNLLNFTATNGLTGPSTDLTVTAAFTLGGASMLNSLAATGLVSLASNTAVTTTAAAGASFGTLAGNGNSLTLLGNASLANLSGVAGLSVSGSTVLTGTISTTFGQTYTGAVTIAGAGATLSETNPVGGITFGSTVTGAGNTLSLDDRTGTINFIGAVSGLSSLTAASLVALNNATVSVGSASFAPGSGPTAVTGGAASTLTLTGTLSVSGAVTVGTLSVGGAATLSSGLGAVLVTTTNGQTYGGTITLGSAANLTAGGTGVSLAGVSGGRDLTVTGNATITGAIAGGVGNLLVTGTTLDAFGSVTTTGTQTYQGTLTLAAGLGTVTFSASSPGVSFNGLAANADDVVISGTGYAVLGGLFINLNSLTVNTKTSLSTSIATAQNQVYNDTLSIAPVTNPSLTSAAGGVTISGVTGGGNTLTVSAPGGVVLDQDSFGNGVTGLSGLAVTGPTTDNVGSISTPGGPQTYTGVLTLAAGTNPTFTASSFSASGIVGGANTVTISSPSVTLGGVASTFGSLSVSGSTSTALLGDITATGPVIFSGPVVLGASVSITASAITFGSTLSGAGFALTTNVLPTFGGAVDTLSGLTVTGPVTLPAALTPLPGNLTFQAQVTLAADSTVSVGGTATFIGGVTATGQSLSITGNAAFPAGASALGSLSVSGTSTLGGTIRTSAGQTYTGAVALSSTTMLTDSSSGGVSFGNGLDAANFSVSLPANVSLAGTVQNYTAISAATLTLLGDATFASPTGTVTLGSLTGNGHSVTFQGPVVTTGALTGLFALSAAKAVTLGGDVTTGDGQSYTAPVTLGADVTLSDSGTGVSLNNGVVGAGHALVIDLTSSGEVVPTFSLQGQASGLASLTVSGTAVLGGAAATTVTTTGTQSYSGSVTLVGDTSLTSGSGVTLSDVSAPSPAALTITGPVVFQGPVTGVSTLTVNGTTDVKTDTVSGSGNLTFAGDVVIEVPVLSLTAGNGGTVSFGGGVSGPSPFTVNASVGSTGVLAFTGAGSLSFPVGGLVAGTGYSHFTSTGFAALGGRSLAVTLAVDVPGGTSLDFVTAAAGITGTFAGLAEGAVFGGLGNPAHLNGNTPVLSYLNGIARVQVVFTPATVSIVGGDAQVIQTGSAGQLLTVKVVTSTGFPIQGGVVTFASVGGGAGVTFIGGPTAVIHPDGTASIMVVANQTAGAYTVTAVAGSASVTFHLDNLGPPATITAVTGGLTAQAGSAYTGGLTVRVLDAAGQPLPGISVQFTAPAGGVDLAGDGVAVTGADGTATIQVTAGHVVGSFTVTATPATGSVAGPATFTLTDVPADPALFVLESPSVQYARVGTAFTNSLRVLVTDRYGNPTPGVTVTFVVPATGAAAVITGGPSVTAAADGTVTVTVVANGTAGSYGIVATAGSVSSDGFAFTNVTGQTLPAVAGVSIVNGVVAQFTTTRDAPAGSFSAVIDWGDASPTTPGTIVAITPRLFQVLGTHTYAGAEQNYTLNVSVNDAVNHATFLIPDLAVTLPAGQAAHLSASSFARTEPGQATLTVGVSSPGGSAVGGQLDLAPGSPPATVFLATYNGDPEPVEPSVPALAYYDIRVSGADGGRFTAQFTLPASVDASTGNPGVEVYDSSLRRFVIVSGSTSGGIHYDPVTHVLTVVFDSTSTPTLASLTGSVFAVTISAPQTETATVTPAVAATVPLSDLTSGEEVTLNTSSDLTVTVTLQESSTVSLSKSSSTVPAAGDGGGDQNSAGDSAGPSLLDLSDQEPSFSGATPATDLTGPFGPGKLDPNGAAGPAPAGAVAPQKSTEVKPQPTAGSTSSDRPAVGTGAGARRESVAEDQAASDWRQGRWGDHVEHLVPLGALDAFFAGTDSASPESSARPEFAREDWADEHPGRGTGSLLVAVAVAGLTQTTGKDRSSPARSAGRTWHGTRPAPK